MVESIKNWLSQNHVENHNMIQEAINFLSEAENPLTYHNTQMSTKDDSTTKTPTKQDGANLNLALTIALEKTFIKPINDAALRAKDKTLYEERYVHVTTIWNTIVDHLMSDGEFPKYQEYHGSPNPLTTS